MNTASWKTEAEELAAKLQELGLNFEGNRYTYLVCEST